MSSKKRELDQPTDRDVEEDGGVKTSFTRATPEQLAQRTILKPNRSSSSSSGVTSTDAPLPKVSLLTTQTSTNPFNAFKANNQWQCSVCLTFNKLEQTKCPCCDTPKSSDASTTTTTSVSAASTTTFTFPSSSTSSTPAFSFNTTTIPTFNFNSAASSTFSFAGGSFATFGKSTTPAANPDKQTNQDNAEDKEEDDNDDNGAEDNQKDQTTWAAPVTTSHSHLFENAKQLESNDSADTVHHTVECFLYALVDAADGSGKKQYASRGKGELKLNTYTSASGETLGRMIMRVEKTRRLILHVGLFKEMKYSMEGENHVRFSSIGDSGSVEVYLLKFRSKEDCSGMFSALGELLSSKLS
jgi:hypothetical protein